MSHAAWSVFCGEIGGALSTEIVLSGLGRKTPELLSPRVGTKPRPTNALCAGSASLVFRF